MRKILSFIFFCIIFSANANALDFTDHGSNSKNLSKSSATATYAPIISPTFTGLATFNGNVEATGTVKIDNGVLRVSPSSTSVYGNFLTTGTITANGDKQHTFSGWIKAGGLQTDDYVRATAAAVNLNLDTVGIGGKIQLRTSAVSAIDTTPMVILSTGPVGISTGAPQGLLDVKSNMIVHPSSSTFHGLVEVSSATVHASSLSFAGSFDTLPTSGYSEGTMAYQTSDHKVYIATATVDDVGDWVALH